MNPASAHPCRHDPHPARLRVDYAHADSPARLLAADDVLAVLGFGGDAPHSDDPRYLRVPLQPWHRLPAQATPYETWYANAPVARGREGAIAWASDGQLLFGAIQVEESTAPGNAGIAQAAQRAYASLTGFVADSGYGHLLRVWNYLDAITHGEGDNERYRQFCIGRARGLGDFDASRLPAATAIGRCDDERVIQVYWLAARAAGTPLENPRQLSAYRYPRLYGPQSPSFARAMLPPAGSAMPLLLSGTASVVGHQSLHDDCLESQLAETFANFDSLITAARQQTPVACRRLRARLAAQGLMCASRRPAARGRGAGRAPGPGRAATAVACRDLPPRTAGGNRRRARITAPAGTTAVHGPRPPCNRACCNGACFVLQHSPCNRRHRWD